MDKETVTHEIKLDRSVKTILWALVVAVMLNVVLQGYFLNEAIDYSGLRIYCDGCN